MTTTWTARFVLAIQVAAGITVAVMLNHPFGTIVYLLCVAAVMALLNDKAGTDRKTTMVVDLSAAGLVMYSASFPGASPWIVYIAALMVFNVAWDLYAYLRHGRTAWAVTLATWGPILATGIALGSGAPIFYALGAAMYGLVMAAGVAQQPSRNGAPAAGLSAVALACLLLFFLYNPS